MKVWLILAASIVFSSTTMAQQKTRTHLKCYLQLEDKSEIVHHFVNEGQESKEFITSVADKSVFMADGVSKKKIESVYECVVIKANFKNRDAVTLDNNTPF